MKHLAQIVLVLFVAFLSTPTIVSLIEKKTDVSIFYSLTEEEIHKDIKVFKEVSRQNYARPSSDLNGSLKGKIIYENLSRHDKVTGKIFSPPPNWFNTSMLFV